MPHIDGFDAYHSEEFKAFCKKVGIPWEWHTKSITIRLVEGEPVIVTHEYLLPESGGDPQDTTTMHNVTYRTKHLPTTKEG